MHLAVRVKSVYGNHDCVLHPGAFTLPGRALQLALWCLGYTIASCHVHAIATTTSNNRFIIASRRVTGGLPSCLRSVLSRCRHAPLLPLLLALRHAALHPRSRASPPYAQVRCIWAGAARLVLP